MPNANTGCRRRKPSRSPGMPTEIQTRFARMKILAAGEREGFFTLAGKDSFMGAASEARDYAAQSVWPVQGIQLLMISAMKTRSSLPFSFERPWYSPSGQKVIVPGPISTSVPLSL